MAHPPRPASPHLDPEGVDLASLRRFFADHVEGADTDRDLTAELISGGRSNLTYRVTDGQRTWVLRRPPLGHVLPTAHDMNREARVLSALAGTAVPVPRVLTTCDDERVNGAPFYVMEEVAGEVLRTAEDLARLAPPEAGRLSRELVEIMARIHCVDYRAVGLADFGRPDGYLERQVRRWSEQWARSANREVPALDELARRLRAALPESGPPAIVHGDYRLDNTMLAQDDLARVVAVLDWEMATLGDPLADVGMFLMYWRQSDEQLVGTPDFGVERGFLSRVQLVDIYADVSGRDVDDLDYYVVLAHYKLAVIVEGIAARFRMGKTLGDGFADMPALVEGLIDAGLEVANRSSVGALRG